MKEGWEIKKLGEVCEVQRGLTYSGKDAVDFSDNIVLRATNINLENSCLDFSELKYLRNDFTIQGKYKLKNGSLLICFSSGSKSHLGKVALIDNSYDYAFGGFIGQINPNKEIVSGYLFYSMISENYKTYISELTDGVNINNLKIKDLQEYKIPLPPLPEQKRIVSILDRVFSAIERSRNNAEQNLKNAKELFESYLQGVFDPSTRSGQGGDDWVEKSLGEVANVTYGFTEKSNNEGDFRYVRITDIDKNGELIQTGKKYIKASKDGNDFILKDNDIVMARTGATFAKLLLYKDIEPSIYASYLIKIDFIEDIDNEFYWFFSKTNSYWEQANTLSTGAAQPHFNGQALKQVVFPYPKSLNNQKKLIKEFRRLQTETEKLETVYQQKLDDLEELKKSVLQKAFNGEL